MPWHPFKSKAKKKEAEDASSVYSWHSQSDVEYEISRPPSYNSHNRTQNDLVPYSNNPKRQSQPTNQIVINGGYRAAKEIFDTGVDVVQDGDVTRYRATRVCSNGCGRYCDARYAFTECETCRKTVPVKVAEIIGKKLIGYGKV